MIQKSYRARLMIYRLFVLVAISGCSAAQATATETAVPPATATLPPATATPTVRPATATPLPTIVVRGEDFADGCWWNDAVFYQIFVRSYFDSDSDLKGDLNGVIEKLDYLNDGDPDTSTDLGIAGIWLMPITESPSYHGYDVVDYFTVERDYGTNEDFRRLVQEAHQRGIHVIVDLVLNHTSRKHSWFESARADVNSPYRDFYVWSEDDPGYKGPWGARAWHRLLSGYYYAVFWEGMPDLNYANPDVTAEMREVIRFWLEDMGADGYRLDGIKHLIENGRIQENTQATHQWLREFRAFYKSINPEALTVGEVWSPTREVVPYVGYELDLAFEFDTAQAMIDSASSENRSQILRAHQLITEAYPPNQFATFLTNHDQQRVMSELGENLNHARMAASLLLTGPGVPFIFYGEEIGHVGGKPDENIRTPMQWSDAENAGFTEGLRAWQPPQDNFEEVNVAAQIDDPDSLLSHYRRLIHARSSHAALRLGEWQEVRVEDKRIYAFLRHTDEEALLVLINLSGDSINDYRLDLAAGPLDEGGASELLSDASVSPPDLNADGGFDAYRPLDELPAYSTFIVQIE